MCASHALIQVRSRNRLVYLTYPYNETGLWTIQFYMTTVLRHRSVEIAVQFSHRRFLTLFSLFWTLCFVLLRHRPLWKKFIWKDSTPDNISFTNAVVRISLFKCLIICLLSLPLVTLIVQAQVPGILDLRSFPKLEPIFGTKPIKTEPISNALFLLFDLPICFVDSVSFDWVAFAW